MQDMDDYLDMETFVNPYDVNPIMHISNTANVVSQVSANPDYVLTQKIDTPQDQLKMEEFSDLSALLATETPKIDLTGSIDELNTPVFDKEAFDFTPPPSAKPSGLKIKDEYYNAQYNNYPRGPAIFKDLSLALDNQVHNDVGMESTDMYLYPSTAHDLLNNYSNNVKNANGKSFASNLSVYSNNNNTIKISNSTGTSPQEDRYSCISSPAEEFSVPENFDYTQNTKPRLNLMLERFKFPVKQEGMSTLNTPDVIDEVVQMGSDFNILDLVNEDITVITPDDDLLAALTSPLVFSSESASTSCEPQPKPTRKRKHSENDDEYVPPTKKTSSEPDSSDSQDSYYHQKVIARKMLKPRGRPPRRADSVSSDGSKDQDVSRYRELRDKNNEASRKSRLKRKIKDQEYEKEADELHMKNIRLKAQVEELEKMVSTFRDNLFKILVAK